MHRSRVYGVFVDVPEASAPAALDFWSAAVGVKPRKRPTKADPYAPLPGALPGGMAFEVQTVDDEPRYHIDIETDDPAAETARLVALGATYETRHASWTVLRAPGGQLVCVVPVQGSEEDFTAHARTWP